MVLREGYIGVAASNHLRKVTMDYAEAPWKVRCFRREEGIGGRYSDQSVSGGTVPGAGASFASIRQCYARACARHVGEGTNCKGLPLRTSSAKPRFLEKKRARCSIASSLRSSRKGSGPAITMSG